MQQGAKTTVACVYWKGAFRGREHVYNEAWVSRLERMVHNHLPGLDRFVCLSNTGVPCERIPLITDWHGWWAKLELFRPGLFEGRVLYLDLDLVIMHSLEDLIQYPAPFVVVKAFKPVSNKIQPETICKFNSSVMAFDAGEGEELFLEFVPYIRYNLRGDQDWLAYRFPTIATFPSGWITKLRYLKNGKPNPENRIVLCMPGKNEVACKKYPWVKEIWKGSQ